MPSNPVPRAIVLFLLAISTCAVVGVAAATTGAAPTAVSKADLKLKAKSYLMSGKRAVSIPGARVAFRGSITPLTTGDQVLVKARRGKKTKQKVKVVTGVAGQKAKFTLGLSLRKRGRWTVTAQRVGSDGKPNGDIAKTHVWVVKGHAGPGWRGMGVRALQRRLAQLGYISPSSGHYSGTTGRAVLAFRKVNRMARVQTANSKVFRKLAKGGGAYKLRYPKAGKHVEFDWTRQVVVLARGSKPVMTITTSSGSPYTPTAFGKFKFWLKQAGYNQKQMYYSTYFHNGQAIHGFSSVPNQPASHGCLRIPIANAIRVYNWIDFGDVIYTYR